MPGWMEQKRARGKAFGACVGTVRRFSVDALAKASHGPGTEMANRAIWGVRKRHEWLAKQGKKQTMTRRGRLRIGLQAALDRKAEKAGVPAEKELARARLAASDVCTLSGGLLWLGDRRSRFVVLSRREAILSGAPGWVPHSPQPSSGLWRAWQRSFGPR